jgi:hypothetical protein
MMPKRASLLISLVLVLTLASTALAQEPTFPQDSDPAWQAYYWNNKTLSGDPVLERSETDLNHDWGGGSPPGVNDNGFSARWTRYLYLTDNVYRFTATSDDGIRVYVDNALIINEWNDHPRKTVKATKSLSTGHHWVVVEFYENEGAAIAQFSWEPTVASVTNWRGEYFDNATLNGTPDLVREDAHISFDWGAGSPDTNAVGVDRFSARWTRTVDLPAGYYRFEMTVDDGGRLWVRDHLLIDSWKEQPAHTYTEDIYLPGGAVPLKMEYYEWGGLAVAKLSWVCQSSTIQNWRGEYFNNVSLSGTPALVRDDAQIDFNWGTHSPASGTIGADQFSVRWTRKLDLSAGRYRFTLTTDDGARLWVNGHLLIDAWRDQAVRTYTGDIDLPTGAIPVKMEYYENTGHAVARLSWGPASSTSPSPSPSPGTVVVDDTDPGFVKGGVPGGWRTVYEGYGGRLTWTKNNDWARPDYNWARWYPHLSAGLYQVLVFIPERYTTTASARYWVSHANGYTPRTVDQSANGDRWVSLGTYWFNGASDEYVSLSDVTGETRVTRIIAFDAVKWVPVD